MVISNRFNQLKLPTKRTALLAVAIFAIANFVFGDVVSAKSFQITDKDVKTIKGALDIFRIFTNVAVPDDKIKALLNMTIKGGKTSADITYGLLVLSAMNEMDLIDMVVSQRYKTEAREYFDSIIDDRVSLLSFWKGVGFDLPRVLSGSVTGSMSALSLNTFNNTNDIISVFITFNVLRETKKYEGLWFYLDQRRNHTSHLEAWSDAKDAMGFAAKSSFSFRSIDKINEEKYSQLELQFATLWNKWGPYITPYGIAESAKEQVKNELTDTLASAAKSQQFAEEKQDPSIVDKAKSSWNNVIVQFRNVEGFIASAGNRVKILTQGALDQIKSVISKINLFSPAALVQKKDSVPQSSEVETTDQEESVDIKDQPENPKTPVSVPESPLDPMLGEMQETIDDISESIDVLHQEAKALSKTENSTNTEQVEELARLKKEKEAAKQKTIEQKEVALCAKIGPAAQNKILFNEIAWMGGEGSANDEWIELKNISGREINLSGWQILDKDNKIKIFFDREVIPISGVFILERTSDDSVPGVAADLIYASSLNNTNEALYLFDEGCGLMDEAMAEPDWPAGNNSSKMTMERKFDLSWQTSANIGGTPKRDNSIGYKEPSKATSRSDSSSSSGGGGSGGGGSPAAPAIQSATIATPTFCSQNNLSPPTNSPIIINEIAWMGSASSSADEWIELKNISTSSVSLDGWQLIGFNAQNSENNIEISFTGQEIPAAGLFLLERTDDNSIPTISTDKIFIGSINDSDFSLRIFDQNCALIDEITATTTWQVGQKAPEPKTMERISDLTWQTSFSTSSINGLFGTAKAENSQVLIIEPQQQESTTTESTTTDATTTEEIAEVSTMEVVINEIAWMGTKASANDEWIELYNNTASPIDFAGWKILKNGQDFIDLFSSTLAETSFYLLERTASNTTDVSENQIYTGSLSNAGEKLELRNASNTLIDLVDFSSGWSVGAASPSYISMERIDANASGADPGNWQNNNLITRNGWDAGGNRVNGTPKYQNSVSKTETHVAEMPFADFSEVTLTFLGSPYLIQGNLTVPVGSTLSIEPGVTLKFHGSGQNNYNNGDLIVEGTLLAEGNENKNIVFTSDFEPLGGASWWGQIYFAPSSQNSSLNYSQFRYAGKKQNNAYAIIVDSSSVDIKNSILDTFNQSGIQMFNSSSTLDNVTIQNSSAGKAMEISGGNPTIKNSNFKNTYSGVFVNGGSTAQFDKNNFEGINYSLGPVVVNDSYPVFSNNTATNNALNGIYLLGAVSQDWIMKKDLPYLIANFKVAENIVLTIDPEVIIKFLVNGRLEVQGALKAEGSSVVFTSLLDDEFGGDTNNDGSDSAPSTNFWDQIFFTSLSKNSILNNAQIYYGGRSGKGSIYVQGSAVELKNNTFKNNGLGYYSLLVENSPSSIVENSVFENCNVAVKIIDSCPQMQNLNFNNCNYTYYRSFSGINIVSTSTDSSSVCAL